MFYVSNDKVIKFINLTNLARPRENIKNSNIININIWKKLVIYRNDCVFYVLNFLIPLFFYFTYHLIFYFFLFFAYIVLRFCDRPIIWSIL